MNPLLLVLVVILILSVLGGGYGFHSGNTILARIDPKAIEEPGVDRENPLTVSLADAADPEAEVTEVGTTLVVRSTAPGFHARAANLIATIVARSRSPDEESARGVAR